MNRLKSSHQCRICRAWLEGLYDRAATDDRRASALRQMANGMCDGCQRKRHAAAINYIRAADALRVMAQMYARAGFKMPLNNRHGPMLEFWLRMTAAEEACVALLMWHPRGQETT